MSKHIVLFGSGKSATTLIKYLITECVQNGWTLIVADSNIAAVESKLGEHSFSSAKKVDVTDSNQRSTLVKDADLVISLLPASLHFLVAADCLFYGKDLLTASYLDSQNQSLAHEIKKNGLLFICELGLDPGIDHMSAMRLIHSIKAEGGRITSFKSHCGGLVAAESDDNPWHYKISWNPKNVVMAGASGAIYMENYNTTRIDYSNLFERCNQVSIGSLGNFAYYPNRDSIPYIKLYDLGGTSTFIRTTLRHPDYCDAWDVLVKSGLTNDTIPINIDGLTFAKWSEATTALVNSNNKRLLEYLGISDEGQIPSHLKTSADTLQYLLEKKLMMQPGDKDMIVMLHEIEFILNDKLKKTTSLLVLEGEDNINTAMAKTVGLPLGITASLILKEQLPLTGLHIPVVKEIYDPVLKELANYGIRFDEEVIE